MNHATRSFDSFVPPMLRARRTRLAAVLLAAGLACALTGARPLGYDIDQEHTLPTTSGWNVVALAPAGQSFIPTAERMNVVEVHLGSATGLISSAEYAVRVHADSMAGPVLGTSDTLLLQGPTVGIRRFDFSTLVPLEPGRKAVLEIFRVSGDADMLAFGNQLEKPNGREAWIDGAPIPILSLWYRTGFDSALPVERHTWGAIKSRWK